MVAEKGQATEAWAETKSRFGQSKSRSGLLWVAAALCKAEAAFCEPLRLIEKPKRPFLPAAAHYKAEADWQKAASAITLVKWTIEITLLQHSFLL